MSDLMPLARGRGCTIRIPDICNHNPETTVGCHYRLPGLSGMGVKSPDIFVAWGCSDCHDVVDRRRYTKYTTDEVRRWHLEGVLRTQAILISEGRITW